MKIFFDTEFIEDGKTIDLISIGMVREDGETFYAESAECDLEKASRWVRKNVFPHLIGIDKPFARASRAGIAESVVSFVGYKPEFWAYYADYDWVALCQLYGTMMDLPKGWPMYCRDLKQFCDGLGNPRLPKATDTVHHALNDARWARDAYTFLTAMHDTPPTGTAQEQAERYAAQFVNLSDPARIVAESHWLAGHQAALAATAAPRDVEVVRVVGTPIRPCVHIDRAAPIQRNAMQSAIACSGSYRPLRHHREKRSCRRLSMNALILRSGVAKCGWPVMRRMFVHPTSVAAVPTSWIISNSHGTPGKPLAACALLKGRRDDHRCASG